jgi:RNA polymerase sigma-70 factor, ECF subfamily
VQPTGPNQPSVSPSDRSLIALVRNGDEIAASELYQRYARRLFGLVEKKMGDRLRSQTTPEDIVQSVFRSVFRGVKSGHYDAPLGETLWNLMAIVAVHKLGNAANYLSAQRRDHGRNVPLSSLEEAVLCDSFSADQLELSVRETLNLLHPRDQEILRLRLKEHTVEEISELVQRSRRTVERSLQKCRVLLESTLLDEETN